jgi:hypothetical protein
MSVKFVHVYIPDTGFANKWLDISALVHAEEPVNNIGIALCYSGDGYMYVRVQGREEVYALPKCDTTVRAFWYPGGHSKCTYKEFPLQLMYTKAGTASLRLLAGYVIVETSTFIQTDSVSKEIRFVPPPLGLRDLAVLAPAIAVPAGIGVATGRAGLGIGIGIAVAGAYLGYRLYKYYRA